MVYKTNKHMTHIDRLWENLVEYQSGQSFKLMGHFLENL